MASVAALGFFVLAVRATTPVEGGVFSGLGGFAALAALWLWYCRWRGLRAMASLVEQVMTRRRR